MTRFDVPNQSKASGDSQNDCLNDTKPNHIKNQIQSKIDRVKLFCMGGVVIMDGTLLRNVPWILLITQGRERI